MSKKRKPEKDTEALAGSSDHFVQPPRQRDGLILDTFGSKLGVLIDEYCAESLEIPSRKEQVHSLIAIGRAEEFATHVLKYVERSSGDQSKAVERAFLDWDRLAVARQSLSQIGEEYLSKHQGESILSLLGLPSDLTKDAESLEYDRMPPPEADHGPTPESGSDDADLFKSTVSHSLRGVGQEAREAAREEGQRVVQELVGQLEACGSDYSTAFRAFKGALDVSHRQVVRVLQAYLDGLEGVSFGSLDANRTFARDLNAALSAAGCAIKCPTCGQPGTLGAKRGSSPDGAFVVRHESTDHSGRATLGRYELVPKTS